MRSKKESYRFIIPIAMFYLGLSLISSSLVHKFIHIGPYIASAGSFVMPFWFILGDIVTEVYGYELSRRLIWSLMLVELFLYGCLQLFAHLQYDPNLANSSAYYIVFGSMLRTYFAIWLVLFFANYCNTYILARLKIMLNGKYFWARSICASGAGEVLYTIVGFYGILGGTVSNSDMFWLILWGCILKILVSGLVATPASIIATLLKRAEGLNNTYDFDIRFSPFRFEL